MTWQPNKHAGLAAELERKRNERMQKLRDLDAHRYPSPPAEPLVAEEPEKPRRCRAVRMAGE